MSYTLLFENKSTNSASIIVYQKDPDPSPGEYSLVWLDYRSFPGTNTQFQWDLDYGFAWGEPGNLTPGMVFHPSQIVDAQMGQTNAATLKQGAGGGLEFTDLEAGPIDSMMITNDSDVPSRTAAEGITMAGRATWVVPAQPNMRVIFDTRPQYWIAFGDFQSGEVLDSSIMFSASDLGSKQIYGLPIQVVYPPGVFAMKATLNADNSWDISPA